MLIKLTNGTPETYTILQLRRDNPNVSFPKDIPAETLESFGVYTVKELPRPEYNPETHYLKSSDFYQVDGVWQMHYYAEPLPQSRVELTMRNKRDKLLSESDWVVAVSYEQQNPVPQEWASYRQQLRDIPTQQGFPYDIIWPQIPAQKTNV
jgi:hypothetical protein